ncbi:TIGR03943 family protein [Dolichospermum planctonicum UHCC 0167]|uniref:TIGR03943 family putative permease subunit n=1 Tax=Dolichospermum planctonicum TaxID=136072 RepID=UPI0014436751|nr:TIGR03943 family protein [Dolichospermum planctonicum]MCW9679396.1 TIGR03943 family protein [Dolichospermum planctonicum UHCC 0167]
MRNSPTKAPNKFIPWLDVVAIAAWGILMLKYWLTGKLYLLIHPDYFWLAIVGGIGLLIIGFFKGLQLWKNRHQAPIANALHINLFPPGWGSFLLLTAAILGLMITPRAFASQTALDRGVTELIGASGIQPQAFRAQVRPEERSLVDWVRTLNVYPEPDAYTGQKVKVQGFVIHQPNVSQEYIFLARFILTCCAADAYPVGLPVQLPTSSRQQYPPDTWLEVEGQMTTQTITQKRQLTIKADSLKKIPQPQNPYSY